LLSQLDKERRSLFAVEVIGSIVHCTGGRLGVVGTNGDAEKRARPFIGNAAPCGAVAQVGPAP